MSKRKKIETPIELLQNLQCHFPLSALTNSQNKLKSIILCIVHIIASVYQDMYRIVNTY